MTIKEKLKELFQKNSEWTVRELVDKTGASKQMVHLALNALMEEQKVEKLGKAPKTVYRKVDSKKQPAPDLPEISSVEQDLLQREWLVVSDTGDLLEGLAAFEYWCRQRKLPLLKTLQEYTRTWEKYKVYHDPAGLVNGTDKLKNTKGYEHIWLDELYYLDFYAIERFGKTRLGTLLHYAKQGQNRFLMEILLKEIAHRIKSFIQKHDIDAVGFVPPTIRRELQLMKFLQTHLHLPLPVIEIKKLSGIIPVPQKSLSKIDERIRNAENTFAVTEQRKFRHILLIDDAVGSGATLNQIAEKIRGKQLAQKISGLAVVGSFKGFDVITDV
jgi:hypothetical protein